MVCKLLEDTLVFPLLVYRTRQYDMNERLEIANTEQEYHLDAFGQNNRFIK